VCGQGHEDNTVGGASGYAEVYLAPNLTSGPTENGCGDIATADYRGGYSAIVAVHELLHTLGALDTSSSPGPPNACPGNAAHVCDNALDIMEPQGTTYWIDDTFLDFGNNDYYGMPATDTWWDVQDSAWLRHLNAPTYTLEIASGVGVASTVSDLPGIDCTGTAHCLSTWDADTSVTLSATPAHGYARVQWGGACGNAGPGFDCTLAMTANQNVTVSYLKALAAGALSAPHQTGSRLQVKLRLNRAPVRGEASIACRATAGLKLVSHTISGTSASCVWSVPARLHGRRVAGRITIATDLGSTVGRAWSLKLRR
jgi:Divergent InlB B-repeat domain